MNYTVVWKSRAEQELAEIWLQAADRDLIGHAVHKAEHALARDPFDVGESRETDYRLLCILPLVIGYRVSEDDRLVTVVRVRAV
jgi:mRNA-degrading endonuclease RelE of RelBE toxin-antitoxin system